MAYKRELIAQTKNLFDSNNIDTQWLGIRYKSISNGKILLNGAKEAGANIFPVTRPNITLPAGSYTLSCRMLAGNIEGVEADFNKKIYFGINGSTYTYRCDGVGKVGDYATRTFTLTEDTLLSSFDITAGYTNDFSINNVIIECQLEKGTTATDYVPYGHLSSYKKLLKVSDVCQLHSPKNFRSGTSANVSFESTDGKTWVVNGTSDYTGVGRVFFQLNTDKIELIKNHHYLLRGAMKNWYDGTAVNIDNNSAGTIDGLIFEQATTVYEYLYIAVTRTPYTNAVFKPQLYDLTEMYGAGNEPSTVAEFKAKFPNELYDYSPRCWVKSYKTGLIAQTKNLFNINALTPYTPETLPFHTAGVYNGNIIARAVDGSSVCFSGKTLQELCPDIQAGVRYTFSFKTNGTGSQANTIYLWDGAAIANGENNLIDANDLNREVCFYANYPETTVATISNFQIEKGTTATDYVPYGYL